MWSLQKTPLSTQNLWMWPDLERGLCRWNYVKDFEIILELGWAPNPMRGELLRGRQREVWGPDPQRDEGHLKTPAEAGRPKSKNDEDYLQAAEARREAWSKFSLWTKLLIPWFWTCGFQDCEGINLCCFKLPKLCHLLWQPGETRTKGMWESLGSNSSSKDTEMKNTKVWVSLFWLGWNIRTLKGNRLFKMGVILWRALKVWLGNLDFIWWATRTWWNFLYIEN